MKKIFLISTILILGLFGVLFLKMISPQLSYNPVVEELPPGIDPNDSPDQIVKEFLEGAENLPPSGTQLDPTTDILEWQSGSSSQTYTDHAITDVVIKSVNFSSEYSLLSNFLNDDPTYTASVNTIVKTVNGKNSHLTITLWDYGLITPWSIYPNGDGWKPSRVVYVD